MYTGLSCDGSSSSKLFHLVSHTLQSKNYVQMCFTVQGIATQCTFGCNWDQI